METKKCTKCKTEKPIDEFSIVATSRDGLDCWCKACHKVRNANRQKRNKATRALVETRLARMLDAITAKAGMEAPEIREITGLTVEEVRGGLISLLHRALIRSRPSKNGKTRRYEANVIASSGPIDEYLTRHVRLPTPVSAHKYGAQERPVKSPEPPTRRQYGLQSSFVYL